MRLPNTKIEACTAPANSNRKHLEAPYLDADRKQVLATNGNMLAVVAVEVDEDEVSGHINIEAIKEARRIAAGKAKEKVSYIKTTPDKLCLANGTDYLRNDFGKFPNMDTLIPDKTGRLELCLDAKLLLRLAEGICKPGATGVRLYIDAEDTESMIYIEPHPEHDYDDTENFGVLMPRRIKRETTK